MYKIEIQNNGTTWQPLTFEEGKNPLSGLGAADQAKAIGISTQEVKDRFGTLPFRITSARIVFGESKIKLQIR